MRVTFWHVTQWLCSVAHGASVWLALQENQRCRLVSIMSGSGSIELELPDIGRPRSYFRVGPQGHFKRPLQAANDIRQTIMILSKRNGV
jgi:hypothetical protein